jgi:hypothetical protein
MRGRNSFDDELARRRTLRAQGAVPDEEQEGEIPRFGWSDILAMVIAAYQILFPVVLLMIGGLVLVYFFFKWFFA